MIQPVLQFLLAAAVIVASGTFLVRFADRIADRTGWGRVLVGSVLLAAATSLPELLVDLNAVWMGHPDLAVGDLLGSSLFNLFILAVIDSFYRHPRRALSSDYGHYAQSAVLSINLTALVGIGILAPVSISFGGVGAVVWVIGVVYLVGMRLAFVQGPEKEQSDRESDAPGVGARRALVGAATGFTACAGFILLASPYLVEAAGRIATLSGLGQTFMGTTFVALSTSLPELVAVLVAFRMKATELALGNIFGSNTFNMILLFPLDVFFPGPILASVGPAHALTAFCVVAVSSVAVMGQISRKREKVRLWEPSSELVVAMTVGFLFLLFRSRA